MTAPPACICGWCGVGPADALLYAGSKPGLWVCDACLDDGCDAEPDAGPEPAAKGNGG